MCARTRTRTHTFPASSTTRSTISPAPCVNTRTDTRGDRHGRAEHTHAREFTSGCGRIPSRRCRCVVACVTIALQCSVCPLKLQLFGTCSCGIPLLLRHENFLILLVVSSFNVWHRPAVGKEVHLRLQRDSPGPCTWHARAKRFPQPNAAHSNTYSNTKTPFCMRTCTYEYLCICL